MNASEEVRLEKIRGFLGRFFRGHRVEDDEDIFARGFVNSMLAIQLVRFLEHEFAILVEDEDLEFDNFRTVRKISDFVARKAPAPVEP